MDAVLKLLLLFLVLIHGFAMGQDIAFKGVIQDENGQNLPKAYIIVLPDSNSNIADGEGKFLIYTTARLCRSWSKKALSTKFPKQAYDCHLGVKGTTK